MFSPDIIFGERIPSSGFCHMRNPGQIGALNEIRAFGPSRAGRASSILPFAMAIFRELENVWGPQDRHRADLC
jgi:hypothetical protein